MKIKKNSMIFLLITISMLLMTKYVFLNYNWETSDHYYVLIKVNGTVAGAGSSQDKYMYTIDNKHFYGEKYHLGQGNSFIAIVPSKRISSSELYSTKAINPNHLVPQPSSGWTECPINEDGTIKEKYKRSNDPWYLKKARYVVGEAMDTSMRYIYRFKWRYASVPNVEIGKHYMLKINADNLKQYELVSTVPIDTAKLQIQTNGGWEECPITKEGVIKDKFKK